jgi:hypothetical protein
MPTPALEIIAAQEPVDELSYMGWDTDPDELFKSTPLSPQLIDYSHKL